MTNPRPITSNANQLVRELIEAEFSSGFTFVRRVPSIETWKVLVYLETLRTEERAILFDVLAERGSAWLQMDLPMEQIVERQKELVRHPAYQRFTSESTQSWPWKYADPSFLRQWLDGMRRVSASQPGLLSAPDFGPVPLAVAEAAEPPIMASAAEIRKAVKGAFTERFMMRPTNMGAGSWNYPGEFNGRSFILTLSWGTFFKLRYGISVGRFPGNTFLQGQTWEGMLGLGIGHWNFVCKHNLAQSVALLGEIIEKMVMLPEKMGQT